MLALVVLSAMAGSLPAMGSPGDGPIAFDSPHMAGEVVVRFEEAPTPESLASIEAVLGEVLEWKEIPHAPHYKGRPDLPHPLSFVRIAVVPGQADELELAHRARRVEGVRWASVNGKPTPAGPPNDPRYPQQWNMDRIGAPAAWDITQGDPSIIMGSIDTGVLINHEDLAANLWVNTDEIDNNGIDDDGNGFIDDRYGWDFARNNKDVNDVYGHGADVAGIMSAVLNNGIGVAGLGNTTHMAAKWWHNSGSDASVAGAVFYAVDNDARVLNMSLSCGCLMPLTEDACNYATANGVVNVAAAGNAGTSSLHYPAGYSNVIAVSAIDRNDTKPSWSNYGTHIDVAGPSPEILTTGNGCNTCYDSGFSGTSAASPHVAGVAGLILSVNPNLTPDEVRQILRDTATDVGAGGFDNFFGYGRVHAGDAVAAALPQCPADIDGDGDADGDDFFGYLDLFAAGDDNADLDGDGDRDADDFFMYLDLFALGC
ncbi:MAG: S8 family serine peptidase [Phycisphaeraceae bacterium]|nr:S8 family serine peptidase [Phycisphaeraceae bacterium]